MPATPTGPARPAGDAALADAARLACSVAAAPRPLARAVEVAARSPGRAAAAAGRVAGLPWMTVAGDDSAGAQRVYEALVAAPRISRHFRLAQAVLDLPTDFETYFRGRSRQALRTNMRRAREAGYVCRVVPPGSTDASELGRFVDVGRPDTLCAGAYDVDGVLRVVAAATVAGEWAHLDFFGNVGGRWSSARYLLHASLVRALHERGVRHLYAGGALLAEPTRYYQHLLGFRAVNLRIVAPRLRVAASARASDPIAAVPAGDAREPEPVR